MSCCLMCLLHNASLEAGTKWTYFTDTSTSVKASVLDLKMGHTLLSVLLFHLLNTLLHYGHAEDAVLTTESNWSTFFEGESVTFICDMNDGEDADWEYKLNKDGQEYVQYNTHKRYTLTPLFIGHSGDYQCVGRRKSSHDTKTSNTVSLTVSAKPRATLTAGTTTISVGGSVTLTCSVQNSVTWKYVWYRRTQETFEVEVNPVKNNEHNRVISVSQGGIYQCRGTRGKPVYYTYSSDWFTIEITFSNEAVLRRQPNWPQMFSGERITLTCEVHGGETTEWVYDWRRPGSSVNWTDNNDLTLSVSESSSGDYMCRSRRRDDSYSSTEWSKAVTLSVSRKPKALLNADIRDIPVGGSVTLICSVKPSSGWEYYWYRDDKFSEPLITKDAVFHSNGQISVSEGGLYRCRGGRGNPVYHTEYSDPVTIRKHEAKAVLTVSPSWLSPGVPVTPSWSAPESCSFTVPLIIGLFSGVFLTIILLLPLLCCCRKIKDPNCNRLFQCLNTNQASAAQQTVNQNETQVYSSLLHGDASVYESIRCSGNTESDEPASDYSNVPSPLQHESLNKRSP